MRREEMIQRLQDQVAEAMNNVTRLGNNAAFARGNGQAGVLIDYWGRVEAEERFNAGCAMAALNHLNGVSPE